MRWLIFLALPSAVLSMGMSVHPGFPVEVGSVLFSSPIATDIDDNGFTDIVICSWDNGLHILLQDRAGFNRVKYKSLDIETSGETLTPLLLDTNDDNQKDVVWTTDEGVLYLFPYNMSPAGGERYELTGRQPTSSPSAYIDDNYTFIVQPQPESGLLLIDIRNHITKTIVSNRSITSDVAVSDIDADGIPEIMFASTDGTIYAVGVEDPSLSEWSYRTTTEFMGGFSLADVDRDLKLEVFTCSVDGTLYGIDDDGTSLPHFPVDISDGIITHGAITTPAVGDMNSDGVYEIAVTTGIPQAETGSIKLYSVDGLEVGSYTSRKGGFLSSPVLVNIDMDSELEVFGISYQGEEVALNYDGSMVEGFPRNAPEGTYSSTPAYGDIDSDGYAEFIIVNEQGGLYLYDLDVVYVASPWAMESGGPLHNGISSPFTYQDPSLKASQSGRFVTLKWRNIQSIEKWTLKRKLYDEDEFTILTEIPSGKNSYKDPIIDETESITYIIEGLISDTVVVSDQTTIYPKSTETEEAKATLVNSYPNPFSEMVTIEYSVEGESQNVRIAIYDVSGKLVRLLEDAVVGVGDHNVTWNGISDSGAMVSNGVYFCRLESNTSTSTRTIILVR